MVIYERDSGRSRGFGFITFTTMRDAQSALDAMNEVEVEGRPLRLNLVGENADPRSQETKAEAETDDNATAMQSASAVYCVLNGRCEV
ncbi:hypothetical protein IFM89_029584 [Coptis chinensis]|uniref:RRM domain-containing protein n=1 Tax=Coptis chinensis TaxID=261450 RepID=A0A835H1S0_9MAGN|nr:hypothetical protein IFM89_029584 [Coptis chinensis]